MVSKRFNKLVQERQNINDSIAKILPIIKKNCTTKFDESIDLSININNKQKKMRLT